MSNRLEELKRKGIMTEAYILHYIKKFIVLKNYPPTFREIAEGTGLKSVSTYIDICTG